jgi:predicted nucleic acid-binding Zn ribbon protein
MSDPPRKRCPKCRGSVRRLIGPGAGLLFRGDGFYITDYRSKEYQEKAKAERGESKPEAEKKDKKDEKAKPTPPAKAPKKDSKG